MSRAIHPVGPFAEPGHGAAAETAQGLGRWNDLLREHFVALDVEDVDRDGAFRSVVRSTLVGHLSASVVSSFRQSACRTTGLVRSDPRTYLQVGMVTQGRAVLEQDGREAVLEAGDFAIYETDRPFGWHFAGPWTLNVLTWPRELVPLGA